MSIKIKIALFYLVMIGLLSVATYMFSVTFLNRGFDQLEEASSKQDVQRVVDTMNNDADQLAIKLSDWSDWDDAYMFVVNRNQAFIDTNLQNNSLQNLRLNFMLFYNAKHQLVLAKGTNIDNGGDLVVPASLLTKLSPDSPLLNFAGDETLHKGIVMLPEGALVFAARPIVNSKGTGPTHGTIIFAHYLASQEVAWRDITHLSPVFYSLSGSNLPADIATHKSQILAQRTVSRVLGDHVRAGYGVLNDTTGQPVMIVRLTDAREIHQAGLAALRYFLLSLLAAVLVASLMSLAYLDYVMVRRIARVGQQLGAISTVQESPVVLEAKGRDEVAQLSRSINSMLQRLYESRYLQQRNESLAQKVAAATNELEAERQSLEVRVQERTADLQRLKDTLEQQITGRTAELNRQLAEAQRINQLMVNRELKMIELKQRLAALAGTDPSTDQPLKKPRRTKRSASIDKPASKPTDTPS